MVVRWNFSLVFYLFFSVMYLDYGYRWLDNCVVPWQRSWFTQIRYSFLFPFFSFCIRVSVTHETIITWFHIPDVINFIKLSIIGIGFARAIIIARKLTKGNKFSQRISWNMIGFNNFWREKKKIFFPFWIYRIRKKKNLVHMEYHLKFKSPRLVISSLRPRFNIPTMGNYFRPNHKIYSASRAAL